MTVARPETAGHVSRLARGTGALVTDDTLDKDVLSGQPVVPLLGVPIVEVAAGVVADRPSKRVVTGALEVDPVGTRPLDDAVGRLLRGRPASTDGAGTRTHAVLAPETPVVVVLQAPTSREVVDDLLGVADVARPSGAEVLVACVTLDGTPTTSLAALPGHTTSQGGPSRGVATPVLLRGVEAHIADTDEATDLLPEEAPLVTVPRRPRVTAAVPRHTGQAAAPKETRPTLRPFPVAFRRLDAQTPGAGRGVLAFPSPDETKTGPVTVAETIVEVDTPTGAGDKVVRPTTMARARVRILVAAPQVGAETPRPFRLAVPPKGPCPVVDRTATPLAGPAA